MDTLFPTTHDADLIAAYEAQGVTLDALPYTQAFEALHETLAAKMAHASERVPSRAQAFHRLQNLRKAGKLPRLPKAHAQRSHRPHIELAPEDETALIACVEAEIGSLSKRDQLLYQPAFDHIHTAFNEQAETDVSPADLWRVIARLAKTPAPAPGSPPGNAAPIAPESTLENFASEPGVAAAPIDDLASNDMPDNHTDTAPPTCVACDDATGDSHTHDHNAANEQEQAHTPCEGCTCAHACLNRPPQNTLPEVDPTQAPPPPDLYNRLKKFGSHQDTVAAAFIDQAQQNMDAALAKIEHCVGQLTTEQVWFRPHPSMNAIGNLLLHLQGNLDQWIIAGLTQIPDMRNRQSEFDARGPIDKNELLTNLLRVCRAAMRLMGQTVDDTALLSHRRIQGKDPQVLTAIMFAVGHFDAHAQEIICLTRMQLGDAYVYAADAAGRTT